MAQRGGSVVTYVRYGEKVYSPVVDLGTADMIVSFERLEALRYALYAKKDGVIIYNDQRKMCIRDSSSIILLGALLSKYRRANISFPGGCELGPRPIDLHIASFRKMGVKIEERHGSCLLYTSPVCSRWG